MFSFKEEEWNFLISLNDRYITILPAILEDRILMFFIKHASDKSISQQEEISILIEFFTVLLDYLDDEKKYIKKREVIHKISEDSEKIKNILSLLQNQDLIRDITKKVNDNASEEEEIHGYI